MTTNRTPLDVPRTLAGFLEAFTDALAAVRPEVPQHQTQYYPHAAPIRLHVVGPGTWLVPPYTDPVGLVVYAATGVLPSLLRTGDALTRLGWSLDDAVVLAIAADRHVLTAGADERRVRAAYLRIVSAYVIGAEAKT